MTEYDSGGRNVNPGEETRDARGIGRSVLLAAVDGRDQPPGTEGTAAPSSGQSSPPSSPELPAEEFVEGEVATWQEFICPKCKQFAKKHPKEGVRCPTCAGRVIARVSVWEMEEWADALGRDGVALLTALRSFANEEGVCWPSSESIATRSGISRACVWRWIAKAIEKGLLEKIPRQGKAPKPGRAANVYRILT